MKTCYLLGPMWGYPDFNRPAFNFYAEQLKKKGFKVINPAELDEVYGDCKTREEYYARDIPFLPECEVGFALPGWQSSRGAVYEAFTLGILLKRPVISLPDYTVLTTDQLPKITVPCPSEIEQ